MNSGRPLPNFTIQAKDAGDTSLVSNIIVVSPNVTAANDAPKQLVTNPTIGHTKEDTDFTITAQLLLNSFEDEDADTLTVQSVAVDNSLGSITNVDATTCGCIYICNGA